MIIGTLRLFSDVDLDRLHEATLRVLERTGLRVCSDVFLAALREAGARVDEAHQIARFSRAMVEELIAERCDAARWVPQRERSEPDSDYKVGLSGVIAPFYYDYERKIRRAPTRQDLLDLIHWAEVDASTDREVDLPVTMSEVHPLIEPIEAYALLLENTARPGRAYTTEAAQISYLVEIATVYFGRPIHPRGTDFMTSPLTFSERQARHTLACIKAGQRHFEIGVMPISGGNAPITPAGNVVISVAEALGGALVTRALAPEAVFRFSACNGIIDLRKGTACFNAPEALLADLGFCEMVNRRYGGNAGVAAGADYIDAALPGIQAAFERTHRAMAIAAFVGEHFYLGGQGTLDAGQIFSPVQFILERDLSEGLWRFGRGIDVSDESIGLEAIESVGAGEGRSYLDAPHTLHHYRKTWFPRYLFRGAYEDDAAEHARDRLMLDACQQHFRDCVARYQPPAVDEAKVCEIRHIVERARQALLSQERAADA